MGWFKKIIHDGIGINVNKLTGTLRETSQKMRETKEKLQNSERVKKLRIRNIKIKS